MDFHWAIEQLKAGRKVVRRMWRATRYIYMDALFTFDNDDNHFSFGTLDVHATDWQLYNEPSDDSQQTRGSTLSDGKSNVDISASDSADRAPVVIDIPLNATPSQLSQILKILNKKPKKARRKKR